MQEYFITARSFAAPFVSDTSEAYVRGESPLAALRVFVETYRHPCGLYAAECWVSADAYHKRQTALATWRCNHERALRKATRRKGSYSVIGHGPGSFEVDGKLITVEHPKDGRFQVSRRPR